MKKSKVYTKTGDKGETSLVSGNRTSKADLRIDLYGDLDGLNSQLGVAVSHMSITKLFSLEIDFLQLIQSALFNLGSNMACEVENRDKYKLPQVKASLIEQMEKEIDRMDMELEPLKNFILPGGSLSSAELHLCRTESRSVERKSIRYFKETGEELPENCLIFLNRLSDYFFVLARYVNKKENGPELMWKQDI
jgi:cob(I)alamin adenosyltransferase